MGYYTNFRLKVTGFENAEAAEFFEFKLRKASGYDGWDVDIVPSKNGYEVEATLSEAKWYDWEKNLEVLSVAFPNTTIVVDGVGEEPGDIWRARVQNGEAKTAQATISFPELD